MGDLTPITREEYYLARMAGEDVTMPDPITREEEYMKGIAAQIEAGSAELPAVTDVDEGKILAVNASGKWDKADAPTELPTVTSADAGDVLTVDNSGNWVAATPGGGGVQQTITDALQVNPTYVPEANIHVKVAKTGQVVTVSGYFKNEYNGLAGNILDLVYKPISALHGITLGWGTTSNTMAAHLDTDGILKTYTTTYDSSNYYFSLSYITND